MKAPIALFVYKRLNHLQRCIEALQKNDLASESDLIVFSDGPKSASDNSLIEEVRNFLKTINGFRSVSVVTHEKNLGLSASVLKGVTEVVNQYGKVIVMEDDLIASRYFLRFMNEGLEKFANDDRVISIHGYLYPVKEKLPPYVFIRGADCWGWGTWKRGWDLLETDATVLLEKLESSGETKRFNFGNSYPYLEMLKDKISGKNNSWAILWYASAFIKKKLTLYPGKSLLHNIGNDNSGTHSATTDQFDVRLEDEIIDLTLPLPVEESKAAVYAIEGFFWKMNSKFPIIKRLLNRAWR